MTMPNQPQLTFDDQVCQDDQADVAPTIHFDRRNHRRLDLTDGERAAILSDLESGRTTFRRLLTLFERQLLDGSGTSD
jgi:hypothetical protein